MMRQQNTTTRAPVITDAHSSFQVLVFFSLFVQDMCAVSFHFFLLASPPGDVFDEEDEGHHETDLMNSERERLID